MPDLHPARSRKADVIAKPRRPRDGYDIRKLREILFIDPFCTSKRKLQRMWDQRKMLGKQFQLLRVWVDPATGERRYRPEA